MATVERKPAPTSIDVQLEKLHEKRSKVQQGGGADRIKKQHASGKLTARERIQKLVDQESFQEIGLFAKHRSTLFGMASKDVPADGVVTGCATVDGRIIHLASQDFTVLGGAAGEVHCAKIVDMMRLSLKTGSPFVFINDSGGARVQEGIDSLAGYASVFYNNVHVVGRGSPDLHHLRPMRGRRGLQPRAHRLHHSDARRADVHHRPAGHQAGHGRGGVGRPARRPAAQMNRSGVVHLIAEDDDGALLLCRRLLSFLPSNNLEDPPRLPFNGTLEADPELNYLVPTDPKIAYDIRAVLKRIVDNQDFFEIQPGFAANVVIGFARMQGRPVGIVASQPCVLAGALDIDASDKVARFVRFCNAFSMPLLTFVDVPGFLPGVEQEYGGIIRHGAKILFAYSAATVPKLTVVIRKAYGGAYIAMCCKDLGADRVVAWPTAEIAVMGAEGAAEIVFRREIDAAENHEEKRAELIEEYRSTFANPFVAAGRRLVDDVIEPAETRRYLAQALEALHAKREFRPPKKHGLIPL